MSCITVLSSDKYNPQFVLTNPHFSYACGVFDGRFLSHLYFGAPLENTAGLKASIRIRDFNYMPQTPWRHHSSDYNTEQVGYVQDCIPFEYPSWGRGSTHRGALECEFSDGSTAYSLEYRSYHIENAIHQPEGMPLVHPDSPGTTDPQWQTLCIVLVDHERGLEITLHYCIHPHVQTLLRWTRIRNTGDTPFIISNPYSASVDIPGPEKDLVYLYGSWGRERHVQRIPVSAGMHHISARNGTSSHQTSPFMALVDPNTQEHNGQALALALGYSGNFQASCTLDENEISRITIGLYGLKKKLNTQEQFDTPMVVLAYSNKGMNSLSHSFHDTIRTCITPPHWRNIPRSILINSWESMYFDINEKKIFELAQSGKEIGAELCVLDDGWFSNRRDDTSSLGDWWINTDLFPRGLASLADAIRNMGLLFGIWVEPEMISKRSTLYENHPEWAVHIPGLPLTEARNQYVLDLSNKEVQHFVYSQMTDLFTDISPDYVKWDMNRLMTEPYSPTKPAAEQGSFMHDYMLGFYHVFGKLQKKFPNIMFESCAGGGGRLDLGLAHYSPRFWTSDQTDAIERLPIQYGTSLFFPPEYMGAHVSTTPNHQVGRTTPLHTRAISSLSYSFGFELDPRSLSKDEKEILLHYSNLYKDIRSKIQAGTYYRLLGPLEKNGTDRSRSIHNPPQKYAWMIVAEEGSSVYVFFSQPYKTGLLHGHALGLPPLQYYSPTSYVDAHTQKEYSTPYLAQIGLPLPSVSEDYHSMSWILHAKKS